jgi:UrcA family protein
MFLLIPPAAADEPVADPGETIVVEAPIVRRTAEGRPLPFGTRSEIVELSRTVSFADLDLSKQADVAELKERIEAVARENCDKLSTMFREADADHRDLRRCEQQAIERAQAKLDTIAAAAD